MQTNNTEGLIDNIIDKAFTKGTFGKGFTFRKGQREVISAIVKSYIEDPLGTIVIDAPTGTGKSLIAMWCAHILKEMGKTGYLITSDLSLQDQYESDFKKLGLHWPSVKGVDNYICTVNKLPFSLGDCKLKGMNYEQAERLSCFKNCGYLQARKDSIESPITLLNYSYWLIQRNYVEDKFQSDNRDVPFKIRDFVFFDEAHRIDEIVQSHFSPRIDVTLYDKFLTANRFIKSHNIGELPCSPNVIRGIIHSLMTFKSPQLLLEEMIQFRNIASQYGKIAASAKAISAKRFKNQEVPKEWQTYMAAFDRIKDVFCKFDDYVDLIESVGIESMVVDQKIDESKFMCIKEQTMIQRYLHNKANFKVFMSATIGDPKSYSKIMGIQNAKFIRLDNSFNYDKSPLLFIDKFKLNMREKDENISKVTKILDKILSKHSNERGIIHSGSYAFSKFIMENSDHRDRIIDYTGSKEKKEALKTFKSSSNKILMGPSILEGLDLKNDISRFQVFFKVPYPSLGDPLIKAKSEHNPDWYDWKTGVSIMQGVGRSVRSQDDWAVTYVLDSCFKSLLNRDGLFPPSFLKRIKTLK
jgi:ATP-dependent DNA helicase DinG